MNFEKFDIVLLITMVIAVVSMSFVFPALGMTDVDANESEIPEFDMDPERFDFAGDFPDNPGTPASGEIYLDNSNVNGSDRDVSMGTGFLVMIPEDETPQGSVEDPLMGVALLDAPGSTEDEYAFGNGSIDDIGHTEILETPTVTVSVTLEDYENVGEENFTWTLSYEVIEEDDSDGDSSWLDRIPGLGFLIGGIGEVAGILGWLTSVIQWAITWTFQLAVNLIGMLFDTVTFQFELVQWLTTTYSDIISSAGSWASIFVAIPGILLLIELAKLTMVAISLLPTT